MSNINYDKSYYINKNGKRFEELLNRHYIVPTLNSIPSENTLWWNDGGYNVTFRIGEFCRVLIDNDYVFYRLKDIKDNKAYWDEATATDLSEYYTKNQIDAKLENLIISGGSGGVELISLDEYEAKKENNEIVDNIMYFIMVDNEPYELYIGQHLIGKKGDNENAFFPYTFPIIF